MKTYTIISIIMLLTIPALAGEIDEVFIYGKIKSIERDGMKQSIITLQSGRVLNLSGSNDVNNENKGIIVTVPAMGRVDIKWRDFKKVLGIKFLEKRSKRNGTQDYESKFISGDGHVNSYNSRKQKCRDL